MILKEKKNYKNIYAPTYARKNQSTVYASVLGAVRPLPTQKKKKKNDFLLLSYYIFFKFFFSKIFKKKITKTSMLFYPTDEKNQSC